MGKIQVKVRLDKWSENPSTDEVKFLDIETPWDVENSSPRISSVAILDVTPIREGISEGGSRYVIDQTLPVLEQGSIDNLVGKLLTYIDATFTDTEQRKAHKDIVRNMLWEWYQRQLTEAIQGIK